MKVDCRKKYKESFDIELGGGSVGVFRNLNRERFTAIDNAAVKDDGLSLKALGLLVKLLSFPDDWEFSENGLEKAFEKDGRTSIRSGLKELESAGYLTRKRVRDEKGHIVKVAWIVTEKPHLENHSLENQPNYNNKNKLGGERK